MTDIKDDTDPAFTAAPRPTRGFLAAAADVAQKVIKLMDDTSSRDYSWYGLKEPEQTKGDGPLAPSA